MGRAGGVTKADDMIRWRLLLWIIVAFYVWYAGPYWAAYIVQQRPCNYRVIETCEP